MDQQAIERVVVIGPGMMGHSIAQSFSSAGKRVTLVGRSQESLSRGRAGIESNLSALQRKGLVTSQDVSRTLEGLSYTTDLDSAASEADLVVESIIEDLPTKQSLFTRLDRLCPETVLLTSNTSGLPITKIAGGMVHPKRAATTHFWNPPHLMPLVEIVQGKRTAETTVQRLRGVLAEIGKRPVVVRKDVPGQLGNRLQHALLREAMAIVQEGIATADEVDIAVKTGLGLRFPAYGPLEHSDVVGLDLVLAVESYLFKDLCNSPDPVAILREKVAQGDLGVKSGRGFFDWSQRDVEKVKAERDAFLMARAKDLYPLRPAGRTQNHP